MEFLASLIKLKLMRLQREEKIKKYSHLLKKENTEILVLSLSGRFIIKQYRRHISKHISRRCCRAY
jgi:hypothetical protein